MSAVGLRAAALAAALVLATLSRGDVIVLALLLVVGAWRPVAAVAVVGAMTGTAWRWGSTALEDISGAQAVLGPAGWVEPTSAAAAAWLGALALVLVVPDLATARGRDAGRDGRLVAAVLAWLPPVAFAAAAALVVAGSSVGGDVAWRVVAAGVGVVLAAALARWVPARFRGLREAVGALAGLVSLGLVGIDAPPLDGIVDVDALLEGVAIGAAAGALAWAVGTALGSAPELSRAGDRRREGRSGAGRR